MSKGLTDATFTMDLRAQRHWDWKVAFYLYGAGTSAGLIFLEVVLRGLEKIDEQTALTGMWIGLLLALASLAFLFNHLGPGARWLFFYVFRKPRSSWIARGSIIVTVLVILRVLLLLPTLPGLENLPWGEGTVGGAVLRGAVVVFAAAFMAYSGLVLSSWNSIPFWNTPLLPTLYVGFSFLAGMAALPMIKLVLGGTDALIGSGELFWPPLMALLFLNGFLLWLYMAGMSTGTLPARESVRRLIRGEHRKSFWFGIVAIGLVLPAGLVALAMSGGLGSDPVTAAVLFIGCGAVQVGSFMLRNDFLRVGVYGYPV
ncbi:MAG: polysulfide reductase NrfD [Deltaproteobacteria bacterium]|nr:polysulfide reductase NrfD [Deltaproteobacteria bacterium]